MEKNKLVSMTEFVLNEYSKLKNNQTDDSTLEFTDNVVNYANFLNQPLTLGMFVPADENNEPMLTPGSAPIYTHSGEYIERYASASKRVLFEGFESVRTKPDVWIENKDLDFQYYIFNFLKGETVEMLVNYEEYSKNKRLTLTPTALKLIYGTNI